MVPSTHPYQSLDSFYIQKSDAQNLNTIFIKFSIEYYFRIYTMKSMMMGALACLVLSNAELIKISGKWFNKLTILSEDGTTSKTLYTPIDYTQTDSLGMSASSLKAKPLQGSLSGAQDPNELHKDKMRKAIKNTKSNLLSTLKKTAEKRLGDALPTENEVGDDEENNQDDHAKQQQKTIEVPLTTAPKAEEKPPAPVPPVAPPLEVAESKLKPLSGDSSLNAVPNLSLRRVSQPFRDTESPFLTSKKMTSDEYGNLSSHQTNVISGKENWVDGKYNDLGGSRNTIDRGNYNQVRGDRNTIQNGHNNFIRGDGSYVRGSGNIIY